MATSFEELAVPERPIREVLREGRLLISPPLAKRILDECRYSRQRNIYKPQVTLLADAMRKNQWRTATQLYFAVLDGRPILVDGQHRMHALIDSGREIQFQVLLDKVDSEAQVAQLYWCFNTMTRLRSLNEVLKAADVAQQHKIASDVAKAVYDAVILIHSGFRRPSPQANPVLTRSIDVRLKMAEDWWEVGGEFATLIVKAEPKLRKRLMNQGTLAVGLVTLKHQPEKAREFWKGVAEDDGLRRGDPRKTLLRDFDTRNLQKRGIHASLEGAQAASMAWNAYYRGDANLYHIRVVPKAVPYVLGTPQRSVPVPRGTMRRVVTRRKKGDAITAAVAKEL